MTISVANPTHGLMVTMESVDQSLTNLRNKTRNSKVLEMLHLNNNSIPNVNKFAVSRSNHIFRIDTTLIAEYCNELSPDNGWKYSAISDTKLRIDLPPYLANSPVRSLHSGGLFVYIPEIAIPDNLIRWRLPTAIILDIPVRNGNNSNQVTLEVEYDADWKLELTPEQAKNNYLFNSHRTITARNKNLNNPHFRVRGETLTGLQLSSNYCLGDFSIALRLFENRRNRIPFPEIIMGLFGSANLSSLLTELQHNILFNQLESAYIGFTALLIDVDQLSSEEAERDLDELVYPVVYTDSSKTTVTNDPELISRERCDHVRRFSNSSTISTLQRLAQVHPEWVVRNT